MTIQGSKIKTALFVTLSSIALAMVTGCGQDPSFLENESSQGKSSDQTVDGSNQGSTDDQGVTVDGQGGQGANTDEGTATNGENGDDQEDLLPGGGQNDWTPDWADGEMDNNDPENPANNNGGDTTVDNGTNTNSGGTTNPPTTNTPVIPGAGDNDLDALHNCLAQWKNNPFTGTVNNYKKINASVSVLGVGNAINDTIDTAQPFLVLIDAGVNVLGTPTYNLMNKNGYYCMKVNVNVLTDFNINLHCNARLADQRVNVNVGSTQNDTTSAVGVHVLSNVQVNTVRPEGDTCIR